MTDKQSFDYWKSQIDEIWLDKMKMVHRGKNIDQGILEAYGHLISDPVRLANADGSDFKRLVNSWLANQRTKPNRYSKPLHNLK